eukprot:COSAG01_NODE_2607_length_7390_cov_77.965574_9_plen_72_part_00
MASAAQEFRRESDCLAADIDLAAPASLRGGISSPATRRRRVPLICEPGVAFLGWVQIDWDLPVPRLCLSRD